MRLLAAPLLLAIGAAAGLSMGYVAWHTDGGEPGEAARPSVAVAPPGDFFDCIPADAEECELKAQEFRAQTAEWQAFQVCTGSGSAAADCLEEAPHLNVIDLEGMVLVER